MSISHTFKEMKISRCSRRWYEAFENRDSKNNSRHDDVIQSNTDKEVKKPMIFSRFWENVNFSSSTEYGAKQMMLIMISHICVHKHIDAIKSCSMLLHTRTNNHEQIIIFPLISGSKRIEEIIIELADVSF